MQKPVGQWRWHIEHCGAVFAAVASRPNKPAVWHAVIAHPPIQNQLLGHALHRGRGHIDLVQEQHSPTFARQKFGWIPAADAIAGDRQAAQISWRKLAES